MYLGRWILRIKKISQSSNDEEEEYIWRTPPVIVHNILFGRLWCEFQGQIVLEHTQSNRRAILTIKTHSWFASLSTKTADMFKYSGFIYDGMYFFFYSYISELDYV